MAESRGTSVRPAGGAARRRADGTPQHSDVKRKISEMLKIITCTGNGKFVRHPGETDFVRGTSMDSWNTATSRALGVGGPLSVASVGEPKGRGGTENRDQSSAGATRAAEERYLASRSLRLQRPAPPGPEGRPPSSAAPLRVLTLGRATPRSHHLRVALNSPSHHSPP